MLIPFRSRPNGNRTAGPRVRCARAIMSIIAYAMTAPTCQDPLGYGGGVSITYVGCPPSGAKRYRSGSERHPLMAASSYAGSHGFSWGFGSPIVGGPE